MPTPRRWLSSLRDALTAGLAGLAAAALVAPAAPASAAPVTPGQLAALEAALNGPGGEGLRSLVAEGPGLDPAALISRHRTLREQFPDLRWQLRAAEPLRSGEATVKLRVEGTRPEGAYGYRLEGEQLLRLSSDGRLINGQEVLREHAILRSGRKQLPVTLLIPDAVLTGQRYDVDVIFDDPLDGALAAGGIAAVTPEQVARQESPRMELGALGGGGLFRTVQAPFTPGFQTWAVLLVHPEGIVSATQRVRVVADRQSLTP